ncbi:MAG: fumarate reductase subunit C [Burkholderiales bacterium]
MPALKTYSRPMSGWWRKNPFYLWYMLREASCVFVAAYALVLLCGLYRLSQGAGAFDGWRATLTSPWSIAFHGATLLFVLYHAWTWFKVMPKTMPFIRVGGTRLSDAAIIGGGVTAAMILSALLLAFVWGVTR